MAEASSVISPDIQHAISLPMAHFSGEAKRTSRSTPAENSSASSCFIIFDVIEDGPVVVPAPVGCARGLLAPPACLVTVVFVAAAHPTVMALVSSRIW